MKRSRGGALGLAAGLLGTGAAMAQSVVQLPAALADSGAIVQNFFNTDPRAGQNNRTIGQICEGPAVDSAGNLYFTELGSGALSIIWKVTPEGAGTAFFTPANGSNGLEFDNQGRLVAAQNNRLMRFHPDGSRDTLIQGTFLGNLNDLSIASTGHIITTNLSKLFLLAPGGSLIDSISIPGGPNGVEIVEEKGLVYVTLATGTGSNKVVKFNWSPANPGNFRAAVQGRTDFVAVTSALPDGLTTDSLGNVYSVSNTTGTIIVYSPQGDSLGRITVRGRAQFNATNCTFGGPGNKTLYISGNQGAYKVQMKVPGRVRPAIVVSLRPEAAKGSLGFPLISFDAGQGSLRILLPDAVSGTGAGWEIAIYDGRQRKVWSLSNPRTAEVFWEGIGRDGTALPDGNYFLGLFRDGKAVSAQRIRLLRD